MILAPRWALTAQAIDAAGDPYLSPGIHLRVTASDRLGLPVLPYSVYKVPLGPAAKQSLSDQISWVDSPGTPLTPPFNVTADNPVTGWLPTPQATPCCFIAVDLGLEKLPLSQGSCSTRRCRRWRT